MNASASESIGSASGPIPFINLNTATEVLDLYYAGDLDNFMVLDSAASGEFE
jgi:hypothetical protein